MRFWGRRIRMGRTLNRITAATHCITLQHTATHCKKTATRGGL